MGFIIYPLNLNIIHFILFNNLDINILLKVIIFILYNNSKSELAILNGCGKCGSIGSINQQLNQTDNIININLIGIMGCEKPNSLLKPLIKLMCESMDNLDKNIHDKKTAFIENEHYKYFN